MKHDWFDPPPKYASERFHRISVYGVRKCFNCGARQEKTANHEWGRVVGYQWWPLVGRCKGKGKRQAAATPAAAGFTATAAATTITAVTERALSVLKTRGASGITPGFFADLMGYGGLRNHGRVGGRVLEGLKRRGLTEGFVPEESIWHYRITEAGLKALERSTSA